MKAQDPGHVLHDAVGCGCDALSLKPLRLAPPTCPGSASRRTQPRRGRYCAAAPAPYRTRCRVHVHRFRAVRASSGARQHRRVRRQQPYPDRAAPRPIRARRSTSCLASHETPAHWQCGSCQDDVARMQRPPEVIKRGFYNPWSQRTALGGATTIGALLQEAAIIEVHPFLAFEQKNSCPFG